MMKDITTGRSDVAAYKGICHEEGQLIWKEEAFDYALNQVQNHPELMAEFESWFFSGNYIPLTTEEMEDLLDAKEL